ncbi:hypothetical protein VCUG_02596 [Vavraia culicis subsp. floridensis]|uniref:Ribosomal RNA large subunit methyltransferase K/L-like methyltransferase domain-containing protein n=1 Tax=Vavraia culicis (isolate floridensis) TaxID=948595 RepID=L2GQJ6_VAVCU|nr:uncharacterized protein VCUG_02596 [Vavraia culicis subsp. floridensis]ELA45916.1 hypothetical protein VCUG_02596 [Vavraia culicis subsp. floridensis]
MYVFLVRLVNTYQNFRMHEVLSILSNHPHEIISLPQENHPYVIVKTTFEAVHEICGRSIFVKNVSFLLHKSEVNQRLFVVDDAFKEKIRKKTDEFAKLYLLGKVNGMKYEEREINEDGKKVRLERVTETFGCKIKHTAEFQDKFDFFHHVEPILNVPFTIIYVVSCTPDKTYFSIHVKTSKRKEMLRYAVPNRLFIGHTAMDLEVSAFMFNVTVSNNNCIVLDPFVGSGSIILYCALMGCYVIGSDISKRQMIGQNTFGENNKENVKSLEPNARQMVASYNDKMKTDEYYRTENKLFLTQLPGVRTSLVGTSIHSNFYQFGVGERLLGVFRASVFSDHFKEADHVITDLPYGIRASLQKETMLSLIEGLKDMCNRVLRRGGRVCFSVVCGFEKEIRTLFERYELILFVNQKLRTCERVFYLFQRI